MAKRRTTQPPKRRDRKSSLRVYHGNPYHYGSMYTALMRGTAPFVERQRSGYRVVYRKVMTPLAEHLAARDRTQRSV